MEPLRLLIADDDPKSLQSMQELISKNLSYEVLTAADGMEAYNRCIESISTKNVIHGVISDVNMPRLTGLELLEKIRKNDFLRDLPMMLVSSHLNADTIAVAKRKKVDQFLVKPFTPEVFVQKVKDMLSIALKAQRA